LSYEQTASLPQGRGAADQKADGVEIFVDVEGDKYLARIIRTFPPKSLLAKLSSPKSPYALKPGIEPTEMHPLAVDLNMENDVVEEVDDPMAYFYNVRLITETDPEDEGVKGVEYASSSGKEGVNGGDANPNGNGNGTGADSEKGEVDGDAEAEAKWGGSVMEVKADQLSYVLSITLATLATLAIRFARHCIPHISMNRRQND
jgi:hypothetical protein